MYTGGPVGANNFFGLNVCTQEGLFGAKNFFGLNVCTQEGLFGAKNFFRLNVCTQEGLLEQIISFSERYILFFMLHENDYLNFCLYNHRTQL